MSKKIILVMIFAIALIMLNTRSTSAIHTADRIEFDILTSCVISNYEIKLDVLSENMAEHHPMAFPSAQPTLTNPSVSPLNPHHQLGEEITFSVTYTDADNDAPSSSVTLVVHDSEDADIFAWSLTKDPDDNNFIDGVVYSMTNYEGSNDELTGVGIHEYRFSTSDGGPTVYLPSGGNFNDFEIINIEPTLTNPSVTSPVEDGSGAEITFSVTYTQADNVAADHVTLVVHDSEDADIFAWSLTKDPADNNFIDGVVYSMVNYEGSNDELTGIGIHEYRFSTSDEGTTDAVYLPESGNFENFEIVAGTPEFGIISTASIAVIATIAVTILFLRKKNN